MLEVHDKVIAPRPGRQVTMQEAEVCEVSAHSDLIVIKFHDEKRHKRFSKITISSLDCVKVVT